MFTLIKPGYPKTAFMVKKGLFIAEIAIIVLLASTPLFVTFPYRVNIFLSWEGAYRISRAKYLSGILACHWVECIGWYPLCSSRFSA